ncbi:hypothetical protein AVEN_217123-1 [Araneus ventricosus]|uniref:Histone-lysine N-methyltransferase SETMAR n=1 Tax=Araneus ventricosus TaxID=182803 RepID=A0A4Y2E9L3_ARAVE|nr:hypothetical protein AVEN_217123-1 [Araneus ventricosus]
MGIRNDTVKQRIENINTTTNQHYLKRRQLHKILWVAVSSTVGLPVERRRHLQSVCLQDVVLVDQTDEKSGWSVLQHPPYSPDLAPSDFHLIGPLKQHLGGKHYADDDDGSPTVDETATQRILYSCNWGADKTMG